MRESLLRLMRFSLLLLGLVVLAGCSAPCDDQVTAFATSADDIVTQLDEYSTSGEHSPIEVALRAQELGNEAKDLKVPTCGDAPLDLVTQDVADGLTATLDAAFNLAMKADEVGPESTSADLAALRQLYQSARGKYDEDYQTLFVVLAYDDK